MRSFIILITIILSGCSLFKSPFEKATSHMENKEEITKEKIREWIKNNSKFPETYLELNFSKYSYGAIVKKNVIEEGTEFYTINHEFKLKTKGDSLINYNVGFRFNINHKLKDLEKEIIINEGKSFYYISKMKQWQSLFGK